MVKQVITFIGIAILSSQGFAQDQSGEQRWECALDLHQGDQGTLSLNKNGEELDGLISFYRNDNVFESAVTGSWRANKIDLTRLLGAGSTELMSGITVPLGTKRMNIGGRYSADYQGVWSANCDLVSESNNAVNPSNESFTTNAEVTPSAPTDKQKVTFKASVSHPAGIKQVSFFLGSEKIHTCDTGECEFTYGPLSKGIYSWRVESLSNSDVKNMESNQLTVYGSNKVSTLTKVNKKVNNCRISGSAKGASAPLAQIYSVKLYGPNSTTLLKASSGFDNGDYQFTNLPAGKYQLIVDTKGDQDILATPMSSTLNCKSKSTLTRDISFN